MNGTTTINSLRGGLLPVLSMLLFLSHAPAATLTPKTTAAWNAYVESARARMQERLQPGHAFLAIDGLPTVTDEVRSGEVRIVPVGQTPRKAPGGLIHDWMGAAFIPGSRLEDVLSAVRDYDQYARFYQPAVVAATSRDSAELKDQFSMRLVNKALVSKIALDSDYSASYVRVDDHRWYSVAESTRIQEIHGYGTDKQRMLPVGEGEGLIWRMASIIRFEERDGGVYVELEAIVLSRDIPLTLRWVVNPIVRRLSKNSLLVSLEQTDVAVKSRTSSAASIGSARKRWQAAAMPLDSKERQ
jgi:hypothetical protein